MRKYSDAVPTASSGMKLKKALYPCGWRIWISRRRLASSKL